MADKNDGPLDLAEKLLRGWEGFLVLGACLGCCGLLALYWFADTWSSDRKLASEITKALTANLIPVLLVSVVSYVVLRHFYEYRSKLERLVLEDRTEKILEKHLQWHKDASQLLQTELGKLAATVSVDDRFQESHYRELDEPARRDSVTAGNQIIEKSFGTIDKTTYSVPKQAPDEFSFSKATAAGSGLTGRDLDNILRAIGECLRGRNLAHADPQTIENYLCQFLPVELVKAALDLFKKDQHLVSIWGELALAARTRDQLAIGGSVYGR